MRARHFSFGCHLVGDTVNNECSKTGCWWTHDVNSRYRFNFNGLNSGFFCFCFLLTYLYYLIYGLMFCFFISFFFPIGNTLLEWFSVLSHWIQQKKKFLKNYKENKSFEREQTKYYSFPAVEIFYNVTTWQWSYCDWLSICQILCIFNSKVFYSQRLYLQTWPTLSCKLLDILLAFLVAVGHNTQKWDNDKRMENCFSSIFSLRALPLFCTLLVSLLTSG